MKVTAAPAVNFVCHGCGVTIDAAKTLPFRCPGALAGDGIDHLLLPQAEAPSYVVGAGQNPFLRYRSLLSPYRLARAAGLSDEAWEEIVGRLDEALIVADGVGFRITTMLPQTALAESLGLAAPLWVKDETGNVSGSHKARHLMGTMLYLRVLEAARLAVGEGIAKRRLAIASCGNAALAAAVIARAGDWPLDVYIPPGANESVVRRLKDLGARVTLCRRVAGQSGDPCFLAFQQAVQAGAIPFGVQGTENGLAVEGARTLAFEMAETFSAAGVSPDAVFVQVGGGALASAIAQGFALAASFGLIARAPRLLAVQADACAPLARAWMRLGDDQLEDAARHRGRYMWPWETASGSVADGILDDETYDWLEVAKAMRATGGRPIVVDEETLRRANELGRSATGIPVSATGSAGLAGLIATLPTVKPSAVIFTGVDRPRSQA